MSSSIRYSIICSVHSTQGRWLFKTRFCLLFYAAKQCLDVYCSANKKLYANKGIACCPLQPTQCQLLKCEEDWVMWAIFFFTFNTIHIFRSHLCVRCSSATAPTHSHCWAIAKHTTTYIPCVVLCSTKGCAHFSSVACWQPTIHDKWAALMQYVLTHAMPPQLITLVWIGPPY